MHIVALIIGIVLILITLVDAFEAIVLPRRVTRRLRVTRLAIQGLWRVWSSAIRYLPTDGDREGVSIGDRALGLFGPLILLVLIVIWAAMLIVGFAFVLWGAEATVTASHAMSVGEALYLSGTTFFTLGLGDITPVTTAGRVIVVIEAGTGFSFLALIIGYVPPIISRFGDRETEITLLDARAGSPPSAIELLRRLEGPESRIILDRYLLDWERWTASLLESHLSYPILSYFRSQHERQSWLATLTLILDTCALLLVGVGDENGLFPAQQARLTFAIARHTVGDLAQVLRAPPHAHSVDRLPPADLERGCLLLASSGMWLRPGGGTLQQLAALRELYEPIIHGLAAHVQVNLPSWLPDEETPDDWETTAWQWDREIVVAAMERERWIIEE
jgi:hypothetical protein